MLKEINGRPSFKEIPIACVLEFHVKKCRHMHIAFIINHVCVFVCLFVCVDALQQTTIFQSFWDDFMSFWFKPVISDKG